MEIACEAEDHKTKFYLQDYVGILGERVSVNV